MTTICELEKQATPGPWTTDEAQPSWPMHDNEIDGRWYTATEEANAKLSAHCRNNFMRALEALKRLEKELDVSLPDAYSQPVVDENAVMTRKWLLPLINELEEAK